MRAWWEIWVSQREYIIYLNVQRHKPSDELPPGVTGVTCLQFISGIYENVVLTYGTAWQRSRCLQSFSGEASTSTKLQIDWSGERRISTFTKYLPKRTFNGNLNLTNLENASLKATVLGIGWCVKSSWLSILINTLMS